MSSQDWSDVIRLAADFQRIQLSEGAERLSERNWIEIISKLKSLGLIDLISTNDGKGYVTPEHLKWEIINEVSAFGGRLNLVDLAKNLNVDLSHISSKAAEIERNDPNYVIVLGQLIEKQYLKKICQEVNDKLLEEGQVHVSDLIRYYDLPSDFLQGMIKSSLGSEINGIQDKLDPQLFYTPEFISRHQCSSTGALTAVTSPIKLSTLIKHGDFSESIYKGFSENTSGRKQGSGRQVSGNISLFTPKIFTEKVFNATESFFKQNGYFDFEDLARMGVNNPQFYVNENFSQKKCKIIGNYAIGENLFLQAESMIEEALTCDTFMDLSPMVPTVFDDEEGEEFVSIVLAAVKKKHPNTNFHIISKTTVAADSYLNKLLSLCDALITKKAEEYVVSGAYLNAQINSKIKAADFKLKAGGDFEPKHSRRDERKKKAAEGKGGGGTQGRETKMKSVKKRHHYGKAIGEDDDTEMSSLGSSKSDKPELVQVEDIVAILNTEKQLAVEDDENMVLGFSEIIYKKVNEKAEALTHKIFETTRVSQTQGRRKTHNDLQDHLNSVLVDVRLYDKGIQCIGDEDGRKLLITYTLKTICTEATNALFSYVAEENMLPLDTSKELTAQMRTKLIGDLPNNLSDPLVKLQKSLTQTSLEEFTLSLEKAMSDTCEMMVRKQDKKKEKSIVAEHKHALIAQLSQLDDPAACLLAVLLVLFQVFTQNILHASGRHVNLLLAFLRPHLKPQHHQELAEFAALIQKNLSDAENADDGDLRAKLGDIKALASLYKKSAQGSP